jgi:hypothetical protein
MLNIVGYSISVFVVVLISGCILNLLEQHYVFQLGGIAFCVTFIFFKLLSVITNSYEIQLNNLLENALPLLGGLSACLISMFLGFWVFPSIREKFKS